MTDMEMRLPAQHKIHTICVMPINAFPEPFVNWIDGMALYPRSLSVVRR